MPAENAKALAYIAQLDDARCNARWDALPELARKIEKHASHRTCLYTTARAEAQVAAHLRHQHATSPTSPADAAPDLSQLIDSLTAAKDGETTHKQDVFAAETCLAWIHWELAEPASVVSGLPSNVADTEEKLRQGDESLTGWTNACIVKAAYLKGFAQEKTGSTAEAIRTYESALHFIGEHVLSSASVQFKTWSEALLARLCLLLDLNHPSDRPEDVNAALHAFRLWSRLMENGKAQYAGDSLSDPPNMRRAVWKAYYDTLSIILQRGQLYSGSSDPDQGLLGDSAEHASEEQYLSARLQQRAEIKLVESVYEAVLLKELRFPKASDNNEEIDGWAESVMSNWRIMCGPAWTDDELGEGGKAAVGKGVLDILYRAATKSYHSTRILRHLFVVHASLAEFDLAFKAFDSYVEIVSRGKDRAEKSGEHDPGLDDDDTVLRTAAEAIRILCRFGTRKEAEKAKEVGEQIEKWLRQQTPTSRPGTATSEGPSGKADHSTESILSPRVLAISYRAVGISRAHWARLTYEATARSTLQGQAAQAFRRSLSPEYQDPTNLETLYALGLLLAEMRDINGAIKVVKRALSSNSTSDSLRAADGVSGATDTDDVDYVRERKLVPLWHLLALLLTAKSDFATAAKTCDAAFEQFDDPNVLFGIQGEVYRSEHLNESGELEKAGGASKGLVDRMEAFEKEGILQVKVTQLMLLEVVEGTTAAVDASMELLSLYKRLYGDLAAAQQKPQSAGNATQSPAATVRSGFLGRSRTLRKNTVTQDRSASVPPTRRSTSSRQSTNATEGHSAPAIQVTDESGKSNSHHHHGLFHHKHQGSGSIKLRKRSASNVKSPDSAGRDSEKSDGVTNGSGQRGGSVSSSGPDQPLRDIPHNITHSKEPPPLGHPDQPPHQDVRLPAPFPRPSFAMPEPRFPILQERRHTISLLIDVWLFIAGLYTRAALFEDAKGAVDEAFKLADNLESEISQETSSAKAFSERGWGGGKSIEELWADIWAARGEISHAEAEPYEALKNFEKALSHNPDHPGSVVGLSNILLDIYCEAIPAEPVERTFVAPGEGSKGSRGQAPDPGELNRLASRDRAYSLLSSLTKLGTGWDYSEAWFALARAYEEGGQIEKAKEVLWWCVELEDMKGLRKWSCVGVGGFVL